MALCWLTLLIFPGSVSTSPSRGVPPTQTPGAPISVPLLSTLQRTGLPRPHPPAQQLPQFLADLSLPGILGAQEAEAVLEPGTRQRALRKHFVVCDLGQGLSLSGSQFSSCEMGAATVLSPWTPNDVCAGSVTLVGGTLMQKREHLSRLAATGRGRVSLQGGELRRGEHRGWARPSRVCPGLRLHRRRCCPPSHSPLTVTELLHGRDSGRDSLASRGQSLRDV